MKYLLIIAIALSSSVIMAKTNFTAALIEVYPSVLATPLNNCTTCHTMNKWQRNPYGLDIQNWLRTSYPTGETDNSQYTKQMIIDSLYAVQDMDSDKDGFTNVQEIEAKTLPGNAKSFPKE